MSHSQGNKIRFRAGGEHTSALTSREKKNQCWGVAVESAGHSFHLAAVFDMATPLRGVNHYCNEKSFFLLAFRSGAWLHSEVSTLGESEVTFGLLIVLHSD